MARLSVVMLCSALMLCSAEPADDPFAVLGVSRDATDAQIKKAFRRASLRLHPDNNRGDPDATAKYAQLTQSYEMLTAHRSSFEIGAFHTQGEYERWKVEQANKRGGRRGQAERGLYADAGPVALWNRKEFAEGTRDRSRPILLNFGARWCVHCQQLAPEYTRAALLLGEEVVVAAVDCTEDEALCQREQVQGYPSIRLLAPAPDLSVESFQPTGHHTEAEQLVAWVQQTLHSSVVTIRSAGEFRRKVLSSNESWVVDFSAGPWCPPCVAMKSVMRSLAARFGGSSSRAVNVAIVDCDAAKSLCQEQQVPFFPVVKLFPHDEVSKRALNGGRGISLAVDQQQMMAFPPGAALDIAAAILEAYAPPRAAPQSGTTAPVGARAADDSHGDEL